VIQPVLLGDGFRLWQDGPTPRELELTHSREWPGSLVELRNRPKR
jgi:hypothetical protein